MGGAIYTPTAANKKVEIEKKQKEKEEKREEKRRSDEKKGKKLQLMAVLKQF